MIIDFHSHILPEVDHGCKNINEADKQICMAEKANVDLIIATPHFYPAMETVESFLERRKQGRRQLADVEKKYAVDIKLGAEVLICEHIENMEGIDKLCIENTDILLLEMPQGKEWNSQLISTVQELSINYCVFIAHIDRYDMTDVKKLDGINVNYQMNAKCLCSLFHNKMITALLKEGKISAIGSDIHGVNNRSYELFLRACKKDKERNYGVMERTQKFFRKVT